MGQTFRFHSEIKTSPVRLIIVMGLRSFRKLLGLAAIAVIVGLVLQFQNCSSGSSTSQTNDSKSQQPQMGGGGYDGKTYADISSQTCPDSSTIRDRVVIANSK